VSVVVAERTLNAVHKDSGLASVLTITVWCPKWTVQEVEASCLVEFKSSSSDICAFSGQIFGIDPLDALDNAISYVERSISNISSSFSLYWLDGESFEPKR